LSFPKREKMRENEKKDRCLEKQPFREEKIEIKPFKMLLKAN